MPAATIAPTSTAARPAVTLPLSATRDRRGNQRDKPPDHRPQPPRRERRRGEGEDAGAVELEFFVEALSRGFVAHAAVEAVRPAAKFVRRQHDIPGASFSGPVFGRGDQSPPDAQSAVRRADDECHDPGARLVFLVEALEVDFDEPRGRRTANSPELGEGRCSRKFATFSYAQAIAKITHLGDAPSRTS